MRIVGKIIRGLTKMNRLGVPAAVAALWQAGMLLATTAAIAQRAAHPLVWTMLAGLLTLVPGAYYIRNYVDTGGHIPTFGLAPPLLIAAAMLMWIHPVAFDVAPTFLIFGLGAAAVYYSVARCAITTAVFAAVLIGASLTHHLDGLAVYLSMLVTALAVGYFVAIQRDVFVVERLARQSLRERAASDERHRIAREIHDVIAHSLSITLLHLTAARRDLQHDNGSHEVVEALVDAERIGRHAMADIRRTVGLLKTEPTSTTCEPGISDITDLIRDFQAAGLTVHHHIDGHDEHVSPSIGLGVYRICQESLANVAKHAPGVNADMILQISWEALALSIRNDLTHPHPNGTADAYGGAGLRGMKQRAELLGGWLTAGADHSHWTVKAHIPLTEHQTKTEQP